MTFAALTLTLLAIALTVTGLALLWRTGDLISLFSPVLGVFLLAILPTPLFYALGGSEFRSFTPDAVLHFSVVCFVYASLLLFSTLVYIRIRQRRWVFSCLANRALTRISNLGILAAVLISLATTALVLYSLGSVPLWSLFLLEAPSELFTRVDRLAGQGSFLLSVLTMLVIPAALIASIRRTRHTPLMVMAGLAAFLVSAVTLHKAPVILIAIFLVLYVPTPRGLTIRTLITWGPVLLVIFFGWYVGVKWYFASGAGVFYDSFGQAVYSFGRRLMLSQGIAGLAGFDVYDPTLFSGIPIADVAGYKRALYSYIYRIDGGSATTLFLFDLVLQYGWLVATAIGFTVAVGFSVWAALMDNAYQATRDVAVGFLAYPTFWLACFLSASNLASTVPRVLPFMIFVLLVLGVHLSAGWKDLARRQSV
jgi:hypothetical protein